jgi:hypothetical protein
MKQREFKEGGGTPNPFTVSQMPFFRSVISKFCRKNKVSQGISKKSQLKIEIKPQFFVNPPKTIRFRIKRIPTSSGEGLTGFNRSIVECPNVSLFQ